VPQNDEEKPARIASRHWPRPRLGFIHHSLLGFPQQASCDAENGSAGNYAKSKIEAECVVKQKLKERENERKRMVAAEEEVK
jgi:hypothetical protein